MVNYRFKSWADKGDVWEKEMFIQLLTPMECEAGKDMFSKGYDREAICQNKNTNHPNANPGKFYEIQQEEKLTS
jgi:hypothetical protein